MNKSKNPLLGGLFSKGENASGSDNQNKQLRSSLIALADALSGYDGRIDSEIKTFKKMIQVGTTEDELQRQISAITQSFQSYQTQISNQTKDWFSSLSAIDFIDGLLQEDLDERHAGKLRNFRGSLSSDTLAPRVLTDIIELLEPEAIGQSTAVSGMLDATEIKQIAEPVIKLLNTIELEQGQLKQISDLLDMAKTVQSNEDLCSLLEGVSDLIIRSIYTANDHVETFLKSLKERLQLVDVLITKNTVAQQAISEASSHLTDNMNKEVDDLHVYLTNSKTLEELEIQVKRSLENITTGLDGFNRERLELEQVSQQRIQELQKELDRARNETENLRDNLQQQRQRALTDPLTKLPNRHAYNERMHLEYNRWSRYKQPLCLVIADIDHFKTVNDEHGHYKGDEVLNTCAQILADGLRTTDFVARYGGEEFVILLPETHVKDAIRAMNKLRNLIVNQSFRGKTDSFNVTMSFGVATFEANDDFNLVFNRADTALYRAKNRGRNQVCAELKKTA